MDAEDSGGLGFVVGGGSQDFLDVVVFEFAEGDEGTRVGRGSGDDVGIGQSQGNRARVITDFFGEGDGVDVAFGA